MKIIALVSEVETVDGTPLMLTASLYQPENERLSAIFFCLPGGSATKAYFNLGTVDEFDYSFISRMISFGHSVITMDHPGTATNPLTDSHPFLIPRQSAKYLVDACRQFISDNYLEDLPLIGLGHSMGGMIIVLMQA